MRIVTCAQSLLVFGRCCQCGEPATVAVLVSSPDGELQECLRCPVHGTGDIIASKPFYPAPEWLEDLP